MKNIILLVLLSAPFLVEEASASAAASVFKAFAKIFLVESADDIAKASSRVHTTGPIVVKAAAQHLELDLDERLSSGLNDPVLLSDMIKEMVKIDDSTIEGKFKVTAITDEIYSRCSAVQVTHLSLLNGDPDAFIKMQKFISYKEKHQYLGMFGMETDAASAAAIRDHENAIAWYQDSKVSDDFVDQDKSVCEILVSHL